MTTINVIHNTYNIDGSHNCFRNYPLQFKQMVYFFNKTGTKLAANLLLAKNRHETSPVVIFSHALYANKDNPLDLLIGQQLSQEGISSLYIDFSGHGASEGQIEENIVAQQREDLESACNFLCTQPPIDTNRIGLLGSSFGSRAAIHMAAHDPRVKTLVLRAPAVEASACPEIQLISAHALIIVGENDHWLSAGKNLCEQLRCPKKFVIVPSSNYPFLDQHEEIFDLTVPWFRDRLLGNTQKLHSPDFAN